MITSKEIVMMDFTEAYSDTCSSVGMAARMGDLGLVQDLVWHGKPVDVRDNRGWTPIHEAAFNGQSGCLEFLLRQDGVDLEWRTFEEETPLILAARGGHPECLRTLLDCDADPNAETHELFSPLWEATIAGSLECVRLLLRKGALINHKVYTGFTPLHGAAEKGFLRIVNYLLDHGARLDISADADLTPIFLACQFGHVECLRSLLQFAREKGQLDLVNKTTTDHATPVLIAAQEGHEECIRLLLDFGASPNIPVSDVNAVAAHFAIYKNRPRCLQLLLPVTAVDSVFNDVNTMMHPLILSLQLKDTTCLEILIAAGLNVKAKLPVCQDSFYEDKDLLFNTLSYRPCSSALCHFTCDWSHQGVEFLLRAGLPCNTEDPHEFPPLVAALSKGEYDLFLLLLRYGANPNIFHEHVGGNLAVLLALRNDLVDHVIVISPDTKKKLYGKYLFPLLMAGANARTCFGSSLNVDPLLDGAQFNMLTILDQCLWTNLFHLMVCLLCFTCNAHINEKLKKTAFKELGSLHGLLERIEDSSGSLAHACRKTFVLECAAQGLYNKESIFSLPIPSILQEYLLFMEYGAFVSGTILDGLNHFCNRRENDVSRTQYNTPQQEERG